MLKFERVVKRYRGAAEEVLALHDVSFTVEPGELVALQGPSGSGKTTLLLLAAAALAADEGKVLYEGRDLAALDERAAAQYRLGQVGLISQHTHLMPRVSAVENAATKLLLAGVAVTEGRLRATEWLERVGLGEQAQRPPEQLSGGERQRVAIARALVGSPKLVLADEPTANLDSHRSMQIVEVLAGLAREQGVAVLLATHDAEAASAAGRVLALRDGRLIAGTANGRDDTP